MLKRCHTTCVLEVVRTTRQMQNITLRMHDFKFASTRLSLNEVRGFILRAIFHWSCYRKNQMCQRQTDETDTALAWTGVKTNSGWEFSHSVAVVSLFAYDWAHLRSFELEARSTRTTLANVLQKININRTTFWNCFCGSKSACSRSIFPFGTLFQMKKNRTPWNIFCTILTHDFQSYALIMSHPFWPIVHLSVAWAHIFFRLSDQVQNEPIEPIWRHCEPWDYAGPGRASIEVIWRLWWGWGKIETFVMVQEHGIPRQKHTSHYPSLPCGL